MGQHERNGMSDEWYTPPEVFQALDCHFDLDAAAPIVRTHVCVPADRFITHNSLREQWNGFVWLNPPFGGRNSKDPWFNKMALHGNGIALAPDRTSVTWWQSAAMSASCILCVHGKIKFIRPDGSRGESPSTGTTLFGYGSKAEEVLRNAEHKFFGIVLKSKYATLNQKVA